MPESLVQVPEGAGKKLHTFQRTIGANNVEDEVVVQGEPYLASYIGAPGADISAATAASHLFEIMAGPSLRVRVRRIELYQSVVATTATLLPIQVLRLSTAGTGGTAFSAFPLDPADAAAGATCMLQPTTKGTEAGQLHSSAIYMMQTIAASAQLIAPVLVMDFDRPRSKPLIIGAGAANGICVKNINGVAGAAFRATFWFDESNF